ncbi:MAG TPA: inositol monophosphatase [Candidatus Sulfotelmatobacter sp.]|jgi:fructose-1,6-bisphosphatase/inositol monophosphatase family enzyme|nr:inositol monophosphatase [Candidatus Sulfotelmatobacter sp.]
MKSYKQFSLELAVKAGEIMLKNFAFGIKKEWKEDNSPVTVSDIAINKLVIESLLEEYPAHGILGEEESMLKESEYIWVCDPLDGTMPYSHGIPTFTFSLALTQQGVPIFGVVYDPILKRMFTAEKGKGAYLNKERIHVSPTAIFEKQRIGIEGSFRSLYNLNDFRLVMDRKEVRPFSLACFTYSSLLVAKGEFLAAVYGNITAWDCAAVKIIIDEAGGKTTDLFGNEQRYDKPMKGFIGSNGVMHDKLLEILNKTLKENK